MTKGGAKLSIFDTDPIITTTAGQPRQVDPCGLDELHREVNRLAKAVVNLGQRLNSTGQPALDPSSPKAITVTMAAAVTVSPGTYRAFWDNGGAAAVMDGTEIACNQMWGLIGAGNYAAGSAATLYPVGCNTVQQTNPIVGENYVKSDGTLTATLASAIPVGGFSMVVAQGSERLRVVKGEVKQR